MPGRKAYRNKKNVHKSRNSKPIATVAQAFQDDKPAAFLETVKMGFNVNSKFGDGLTLLSVAIELKKINILTKLLELGADPNILVGNSQMPPLNRAIQQDQFAICEMLLKYKANPNLVDIDGYSPLFFAVMNGNCKIIQLLIAHKANIEEHIREGNRSYLSLAIEVDKFQVVKELIKYGVNVDERVETRNGTALIKAVQLRRYDHCELLLQNGADPNIADKDGFYPIHYALFQENLTIIELLIAYKANIKIDTINTNETYIIVAIQTGNMQIIEKLLQYGADPNEGNFESTKPLETAVMLEKKSITVPGKCTYNNSFNQDKVLSSSHGKTFGIIKLLLENGANPLAADRYDITPYELALAGEMPELCKLMMDESMEMFD